jgi:hypothetical protein
MDTSAWEEYAGHVFWVEIIGVLTLAPKGLALW